MQVEILEDIELRFFSRFKFGTWRLKFPNPISVFRVVQKLLGEKTSANILNFLNLITSIINFIYLCVNILSIN